MVEHVQTKKEIEAVLVERGLRPRKRFGQHFLIDGNLMRRLADSAEVQASDLVLEVGPGTGGLTDLLSRRAAKVVCVEIDRDLCEVLRGRFGWDGRITIVEGDILRTKHQLSQQVDEILRRPDPELQIKLVANLPYQVATPLVMNLLVGYSHVRRLCFTVQAEVGDRITARPGGKDYGPLAIISQALCDIRQVARIGPQAFWPQPTVDSVMLRMDVTKEPLRGEMSKFAEFVRGMFDHRRKQLRAAAAFSLSREEIARLAESHDMQRRPEEVPVEEWMRMYQGTRAQTPTK